MLRHLLVAGCVFTGVHLSHAGELDNETLVTQDQLRFATELPATVVVRIADDTNDDTNEVSVLHLSEALPADATGQAWVHAKSSEFKPMLANQTITGELDRNSSRSSWYFYFYNANYWYPTYWYYGYSYSYYNYYWYSYGGYSYTYYRWAY